MSKRQTAKVHTGVNRSRRPGDHPAKTTDQPVTGAYLLRNHSCSASHQGQRHSASAMLRAAAEPRLPVPRLGDDAAFDDVIDQLLTDILNRQAAGRPAPRRATASPSGWPRPGEDRSRPPRPPAGSPPTDGGTP